MIFTVRNRQYIYTTKQAILNLNLQKIWKSQVRSNAKLFVFILSVFRLDVLSLSSWCFCVSILNTNVQLLEYQSTRMTKGLQKYLILLLIILTFLCMQLEAVSHRKYRLYRKYLAKGRPPSTPKPKEKEKPLDSRELFKQLKRVTRKYCTCGPPILQSRFCQQDFGKSCQIPNLYYSNFLLLNNQFLHFYW